MISNSLSAIGLLTLPADQLITLLTCCCLGTNDNKKFPANEGSYIVQSQASFVRSFSHNTTRLSCEFLFPMHGRQ